MSARTIQFIIAGVFFLLGGWCVIAPESVLDLTVRPAYRSDDLIVPLLIACFGAQALIAGLFAAFATFTRRTFFAYGVAVLPFFWFDYHFFVVEPVFNEFLLLDAVGNVIFVVMCVLGYRALSTIRS
ncbi:MAG: hypothetical protein WDM79_09475 [Terricaulis sp.]